MAPEKPTGDPWWVKVGAAILVGSILWVLFLGLRALTIYAW